MKKQLLAVLLTITVASNMLVGCEGSAAAATTEVSTEAGVMTEASVEIPEGASEGTTGTETESSEYKGSDTTGQIGESFECYSDFDALGRCGTAVACISEDLMPSEPRGNIGMVKPTGWVQEKYPGIVDSEPPYLYNICKEHCMFILHLA